MAFMQPSVHESEYYTVETSEGIWIVPSFVSGIVEHISDLYIYVQGKIEEDQELVLESGWVGRMSASGYMDSTDWCAYENEADALADLKEMYGDDEED